MALTAVARAIGQVCPPIPRRASCRIRLKPSLLEGEALPKADASSGKPRRSNLGLATRRSHRRQAHEVGSEIEDIIDTHLGEGCIREGREVVPSLGRDSLGHGHYEVDLGPIADASLGIRREIRGVERPHGCEERGATGGRHGGPSSRRRLVTGQAAASVVQGLSVGQVRRVGGYLSQSRPGRCENEEGGGRHGCGDCRSPLTSASASHFLGRRYA